MMHLNSLLHPQSIALFGSPGEELAKAVADNVINSSLSSIFLINSGAHPPDTSHRYYRADELPLTPDLALICTSVSDATEALAQACAIGIKTAVVISPDPQGSDQDTPLKKSLREIAERHGCRFLGPSSAGLNMPIVGLNASWMADHPASGRLAIVSQSGSIAAGAAHWATSHGIGLSRVISTGDEADITLDEILDCLAGDTATTGVLLYLRSLESGRSFVSSARALARIKPILVLKPNEPSGFLVADSFIRQDQVYDSVFHRLGILRVHDTAEWFDAAAALGNARRKRAGKIAILANADGAARLATGPIEAETLLASFQEPTIQILGGLTNRSAVTNPVIFDRNVTGEDYAAALSTIESDANVSAALIIHSPSITSSTVILTLIAEAASKSTLQVSVCCFGQIISNEMRSILGKANVTLYDLPEKAARSFIYLDRYRRSQEALRQIPNARRRQLLDSPAVSLQRPAQPLLLTDEKETPLLLKAVGAIWQAVWVNRDILDDECSDAVLRAYGFGLAQPIDGKILPLPVAFGIGNDPTFGRIVIVNAAGQHDVLVPPLNNELTRELGLKTQTAIKDASGITISAESIQSNLIRLADMAIELPEITMLRTKSLAFKEGDLTVASAQIWVAAPDILVSHLSFHPYPTGLEERVRLKHGNEVLIRPIRIEDIRHYRTMLDLTPADDLMLRFFGVIRDTAQAIPTDLIANLIHLDYSRDMTFIAIGRDDAGEPEAFGVVEVFISPGRDHAEYSVLVRSDTAGSGLGLALMQKVVTYCRAQKVASIFGLILRRNVRMLGLCAKLGFVVTSSADDDPDVVKAILTL